MSTTFTKEEKPGRANPGLTFNDMTMSWDDVTGTWDSPQSNAATGFTKESKPAAFSGTKESKPTTGFTKESKP